MAKSKTCLKLPCGQDFCDPLNVFEKRDGAVYTPYVNLKVGNEQDKLSISTGFDFYAYSSLERATISSFEYSYEIGRPGWGADFELVDYTGRFASRLIQYTNKTLVDANKNKGFATFDFGWIIKRSDGTTFFYSVETLTRSRLAATIHSLDQSYEGNSVKLKISLKMPEYFDQTGQKQIYGGEPTQVGDTPSMHLVQAVRELLTKDDSYPPPQWLNRFNGPIKFQGDTLDERLLGPKGAWPCRGKTKLDTVRDWLNEAVSKDGLGFLLCVDSFTGLIIIRETPLKKSGEFVGDGNSCNYSLGTFIVNGGNCSPVLEFRPTINYMPFAGVGNSSTSPGGSASSGIPTTSSQTKQTAGPGAQITVPSNLNSSIPPDDQAQHIKKTLDANAAANVSLESRSAIEANLKLIGQIFEHQLSAFQWNLCSVSIIFIDPWHLSSQQSNDNELRWTTISKSNCNPYLTNKRWDVLGINYQIQNGTFTTNLKLKLLTPNVELAYDSSFGGGNTTASNDPFPARPAPAI